MEFLIMFLILAVVIILTLNFSHLFHPRIRLDLETEEKKPKAKSFFSLFAYLLKPLGLINRPLAKFPYAIKLGKRLEALKITLSTAELLGIKEILFLVGGVLTSILFSFRFMLIGALFAFFAPDFILAFKINAKKREIARVLPESIDILNMCISAGLDFLTSIQWIVDKAKGNPFIEQLQVMASEIHVGKPRIDALKDMGRRLDCPEVASFVRTLVLADRMGTPVAEAFRILSEDMRAMRFQRGERFAMKASIKILFPLMFCILPVILIVVAGPIIIKFSSGELFPGGGAAKGGMGF